MTKLYKVKAKSAIALNFSIVDKNGNVKAYTFDKEWKEPFTEEELSYHRFQKLFNKRKLLKKEITEKKFTDKKEKDHYIKPVTKVKKSK